MSLNICSITTELSQGDSRKWSVTNSWKSDTQNKLNSQISSSLYCEEREGHTVYRLSVLTRAHNNMSEEDHAVREAHERLESNN